MANIPLITKVWTTAVDPANPQAGEFISADDLNNIFKTTLNAAVEETNRIKTAAETAILDIKHGPTLEDAVHWIYLHVEGVEANVTAAVLTISEHDTAITNNIASILSNDAAIAINFAGIAANLTSILTLGSDVATNTLHISDNTAAIAALTIGGDLTAHIADMDMHLTVDQNGALDANTALTSINKVVDQQSMDTAIQGVIGALAAHGTNAYVHLTADEKDALVGSDSPLTASNPVVDKQLLLTIGQALADNLNDHIADTGNPHQVTYSTIGGTQPAPATHIHTEADVTDLDKYTKAEVDGIDNSTNSRITAHEGDDNRHLTSDFKAALDGAPNPLTGLNHLIGMVTFSAGIQAMVDNLENHATNYELHLGSDQNAAFDNANSPSGSNPVATMNDIPSPPPPPDLTGYARVDAVNEFTENQHFAANIDIGGNVLFKANSGLNVLANVNASPDQKIYHFNGNGETGDDDVTTKLYVDSQILAAIPNSDDPPHINAEEIGTFKHIMEVPGMIVTKVQLEAEFGLLTYDYIVIIVDNDSSKEFMIHYRADNHSWHLVPMIQL